MPHSTELPAGAIDTYINYFDDAKYGGKEQYVTYYMTAGARRQKHDKHAVRVHDIRESDEAFDIDTTGFKLVEFDIAGQDFTQDEHVRQNVYPKVEELIKEHTGATFVYVLSHIVRNVGHELTEKLRSSDDIPDMELVLEQHPQMFAHVDQSHKGAYVWLERYNGAIGPNLLEQDKYSDVPKPDLLEKAKHRWAIMNVWMPLKPINREPLALCDGRTVADSDLRPVISRAATEISKTGGQTDSDYLQIAYNPNHNWYWASGMDVNEALLFKCFDSKLDGRTRRAPHTAIQTPFDDGPARESVEIRCFVFWEDQELE